MRAFEPLELGSMTIAARIVRSATNERAADGDGAPVFCPLVREGKL